MLYFINHLISPLTFGEFGETVKPLTTAYNWSINQTVDIVGCYGLIQLNCFIWITDPLFIFLLLFFFSQT
jgi:hypothetical protein